MRYISSKLNTCIESLTMINNIERLILNIIFWTFIVFAFIYMVLLGNMVKNIVERQSLELTARTLSSEVRNLEVTYLSLSNKVDLPLSYSLGFKDTEQTFVTRKALGFNSIGGTPSNTKIAKNEI